MLDKKKERSSLKGGNDRSEPVKAFIMSESKTKKYERSTQTRYSKGIITAG